MQIEERKRERTRERKRERTSFLFFQHIQIRLPGKVQHFSPSYGFWKPESSPSKFAFKGIRSAKVPESGAIKTSPRTAGRPLASSKAVRGRGCDRIFLSLRQSESHCLCLSIPMALKLTCSFLPLRHCSVHPEISRQKLTIL